jgi:hypothetical protein
MWEMVDAGSPDWTRKPLIAGRAGQDTRCAASDTTHCRSEEIGMPNQFPRPVRRLLRCGLLGQCRLLFCSKLRQGA